MQPGYISLVECNPMPATSTGIVAHATGRHEISRVECNPMPTTSMGIVAHATGRHEMSLVACNPMPTTSTGIVPHATGRHEMSRVAYNPMPTIPYGDCPTCNWAERNVPRCIQPGDTRSPTCISPMRIYRLSFLLPIKFILETLNIGIVQESSEFIRG